MYFKTILTIGRDVVGKGRIQEIVVAHGAAQFGIALHAWGGVSFTRMVCVLVGRRVEIMVPSKHHKLFLRLRDLG